MAIETGTASGHYDLLSKLRDFLVSEGWEQIGGVESGPITSDEDFVSLKGTGVSGDDEILVSLRTVTAPGNNAYSIGVRGHTVYVNPGVDQPGSDSPWAYMLTLNTPVTYWFVANSRRFIVIVKTSSRYDSMYAGFLLSEHLPTAWSYPLFIGASCPFGNVAQSSDAAYHSNFWCPFSSGATDNSAQTSAYLFAPMYAWLPIFNGSGVWWAATGRMTLPWAGVCQHNLRRQLDGEPWFRRGQVAGFARGASGYPYTQLPEGGSFYGSLDGVFYTPAFGATAEQEAEVGGVTYKMFPNVGRSNDGQYVAIAME